MRVPRKGAYLDWLLCNLERLGCLQVVGRVHGEASLRVVERLNTTAVGLNDEPINSMRVADCGQTDSDVSLLSSHNAVFGCRSAHSTHASSECLQP